MASTTSTFNFDKLDGASNYSAWATDAMYMLMNKDLWEVVDGSEDRPSEGSGYDRGSAELAAGGDAEKGLREWNRKNNRARAAIALSVNDGPKGYIEGESTAKGMWDKLRQLYEERGYNARFLALKSLISVQYEDTKSIEEYTEHIKQTTRRLANMGSRIDDWIVTSVLLANLGPTFETYVTTKRQAARTKDPELDEVIAELIDESRVHEYMQPTAMALRRPSGKTKGSRANVTVAGRLATCREVALWRNQPAQKQTAALEHFALWRQDKDGETAGTSIRDVQITSATRGKLSLLTSRPRNVCSRPLDSSRPRG